MIRPILLALAALCWSMPALSADPFAADRWQHRLLVVFAPAPIDADLRRQRAEIAAAHPGFAERDLRVVEIVGEHVTGATAAAPALRARFHVPAGTFRALLIGKDGGVKIADAAPLTAARLFETIDAMPMRAGEMRRR